MQIVIDIDEEQYKFIKQSMTIDKVKDYSALLFDICEHIANSTPLPQGHGRIADVDKMLDEMRATKTYDILFALERVNPIIEADKESKEV